MHGDPETGGSLGQVGNWVFVAFFFLLPEGGDVSQVQSDISWKEEVSPWPIITFWDLLLSFNFRSYSYKSTGELSLRTSWDGQSD
jgi:hypothetical protein